jgi:hypothetical protein
MLLSESHRVKITKFCKAQNEHNLLWSCNWVTCCAVNTTACLCVTAGSLCGREIPHRKNVGERTVIGEKINTLR